MPKRNRLTMADEIRQRVNELARLQTGCCPIHGTPLAQTGVAWTQGKRPRPYADRVGCPRKACTFEVVDNVSRPERRQPNAAKGPDSHQGPGLSWSSR